jgi:hypothetical protein
MKPTKTLFTRVLVVLFIVLCDAMSAKVRAVASISIPRGAHVLIDGKLGPGEWADARRVAASDSVAIYLKRDTNYLYVAVQPTAGASNVDLYFERGEAEAVLDLHASAKLGEREGPFGQWPEWWNNREWAANVVRVATFEPQEFLADEVKEYQINVKRLKVRRIRLSADVQRGRRHFRYPAKGQSDTGGIGWSYGFR